MRDATSQAQARHLWVERLSAQAAVWAAISALRNPTMVYCVETTRGGLRIMSIASRCLGKRISMECRVIDMGVTDETGHALYRRHEIMLARLSRSIIPDDPAYRWLPSAQRADGDIWARVLASNFHDRWHQVIAFLVWVENLYRTNVLSSPADRVRVLIPDGWLAGHFAHEYCAGRWCPMSVSIMRRMSSFFQFYPLPLYPIIGAVRLLLMAYRHAPKSKVDADAIRAGTVLVQYHEGALDTHRERGNLLWQESSGIDDSRVVLLVNRHDSTMTGKLRETLDRSRYGWIEDMHQIYSSDRPVQTAASALMQSLSALPMRWSSVDVARWATFAYINLRVAACRKLFRANNVRLCIFSWIFYTDTGIFALAARQEGAIYVRWTKSMHGPFQNIFHRSFADIAFVWGEYDRAFLRSHDFRYSLMLTTGMIGGDYAGEDAQRAVLKLRSEMAQPVSFVIGLFDTGYNRKLYNSQAHIIAYYRHMLAMVQKHPHWACIIKTKVDVYGSLPQTAGVQDVVAELTRQGRCIVLDGGEPPSALARSVSAVVCCNINMAGQLVAMHGVPVLHLDYSGQYYVTWYDVPSADTTFFTEPEKIEPALMAIERGDRTWGDASPWRTAIDQFHDGRGRERLGEAVRYYLDQAEMGATREQALDNLAVWYASRYGDNTVCRPGDPAQSAIDAWIVGSHDKFYAERPAAFPRANPQAAHT